MHLAREDDNKIKPTGSATRGFVTKTVLSKRRSGGRGFGLLPLSTGGLDDDAVAHRLGADLHANDPPVDDGANLLNIRLELTGGNPGHLGSDAAKILGFAAMGDLLPEGGLLAGKMTDAWHSCFLWCPKILGQGV